MHFFRQINKKKPWFAGFLSVFSLIVVGCSSEGDFGDNHATRSVFGVENSRSSQREPVNMITKIAHWAFEDNLDSNENGTMLNGTGKDQNGTIGNVSDILINEGVSNTKALDIGSGEYVDIGNQPALDFAHSDPFSVSFWMKRDNTNAKMDIISKMLEVPGTNGAGWTIHVESNGKMTFNLRHTSGSQNRIKARSTTTISPGTTPTDPFYHIVATYKGTGQSSDIQFYVNGLADTTIPDGAGTEDVTSSNAPANIGARNSVSHHYDGVLDEVQVFEGELLAIDVTCLHELPTICETGSLVWDHGVWGQEWH